MLNHFISMTNVTHLCDTSKLDLYVKINFLWLNLAQKLKKIS
jgi:hypothetical protein